MRNLLVMREKQQRLEEVGRGDTVFLPEFSVLGA
jgi:hypothetical protein